MVVVFPASMWAMIPMLRIFSKDIIYSKSGKYYNEDSNCFQDLKRGARLNFDVGGRGAFGNYKDALGYLFAFP